MMHFSQSRAVPHPGDQLRAEIEDLGISIRAFARALDVPHNRLTAILNGQRAITADTALRLSVCLGTPAEMWLDLQKQWDLQQAQSELGDTLLERVTPL